MAGSITDVGSLEYTQLNSLCILTTKVTETTRILEKTANTLRNARKASIIVYLVSLGGQGGANISDGSLVQHMFIHFDKQIRSISQDVLDNSSYGLLWRVKQPSFFKSIEVLESLILELNHINQGERICSMISPVSFSMIHSLLSSIIYYSRQAAMQYLKYK